MEGVIQATQGLCIDGVNSAVRPDLIGPNQLAWMLNGTVRDGKPRTRCALVERLVLPAGRVQGVGYFSDENGLLVGMFSGVPYRIDVNGPAFSSQEISLSFANSPIIPVVYMVETAGSLVIQDGQSNAIIYDGATGRRADLTIGEVPIGKQMAYGNGRLAVVVGQNLKVGDIFDPESPGSELLFTETGYLSGGGAFGFARVPTGLAFIPSNDTATGYGSMIVFGKKDAQSLRLEVTSRDLWQIIPGFEVVVLDDVGTPSQLSITKVEQDLWWRDVEGQIRTLRAARSDANQPGNTGLSREVAAITDFETQAWLSECSGMYFNNRIFFTASPFLHKSGCIAFKNLISLDAAPLATMRGKQPPAYDGAWCGVNFVRLVKGEFFGQTRGFAISSDDDGNNRLWEIMPDQREDSYLSGSTRVASPIEVSAEFRRFDMGDPTKLKCLTRCDIYPTDIEGDVTLSLYWRTDSRTQWQLCDTVEFCAKMTDASTASPHVWKNLRSQERGKIKSFTFPDLQDAIAKQLQTVGYSFQIRLVWQGNMLIDRIDVLARPMSDRAFSDIADLDTACVDNDVSDNVITYSILP